MNEWVYLLRMSDASIDGFSPLTSLKSYINNLLFITPQFQSHCGVTCNESPVPIPAEMGTTDSSVLLFLKLVRVVYPKIKIFAYQYTSLHCP